MMDLHCKRILIAEDDAVFRRVIAFTLTRSGFSTTVAPNGIEALRIFEQEEFDCLVTDQQMPGLTGIQLIERIRCGDRRNGLPIILCTAKGLELDTQFLTQRYELAAVLHKPFSPRKLAEILATTNQTVESR